MNPTVTPTEAPPAASAAPSIARAPRKQEKRPLYRFVEALASLRITVVLFALSLLLVFYGTLAQVDNGIWTVVKQYFRSAYVWIPTNVVLLHANRGWGLDPKTHEPLMNFPGSVLYPGGWLLGGLLLVNLLAAHAVRFKVSWKRSGILLIHAGIIVMMLSELVTGLFAVEGHMQIEEGHSSSAVVNAGTAELCFEHIAGPKQDEITVVPASLLRPGAVIEDEHLPVRIEVKEYMTNSDVVVIKDDTQPNPATKGHGLYYRAVARAEVSGVDTEQRHDAPSTYVILSDPKTKQNVGGYLFTLHLAPEWVELGGKQYRVSLRFKHTYRPFSLHLEKFDYKKFVGTEMAKDYRSHIRLLNPQTGEDRKLQIYMNTPLSYAGETFYQSGVLQDAPNAPARGTILQVVHNPGWGLPYLACFMVSLGMLIHFGINLVRFIERRAA